MVSVPEKEEGMNMRKRYAPRSKSRFDRWWQEFDSGSVSSYLLLPIMAPFLITKLVLYGMLALVILFELAAFPSAWDSVKRAFHKAEALGKSDHDSTRLKGGEARQKGSERKGSLVRPGGPLCSDDLRRRLYELRTPNHERKDRRALKRGGRNGE